MRRFGLGVFSALCLIPHAAEAVVDKYHVTATEKIACTRDVMRLCFYTYPDEDKMISCMQSNLASLSETCRVAFVAGMRRRHLE